MWKQTDCLTPEADEKFIAEAIYLMTSLETYIASTRELNRSPDEHEEWVFRSLEKLVFP